MGIWRHSRRRWFIPKYDELTIFMMTVALLLLFFFDESFRSKVFWLIAESGRDAFRVAILILFFLAGGLLSIYHVFTERRKTKTEKFAMLVFAVMTNALCGFLASGHILDNWGDAPHILIVFPLWNGINCLLLLLLFRVGVINETSITDENARSGEVIFGFVIILGIFVVCRFVFELYWALTLSICAVYAASFSDALGAVFGRAEPLAAVDTGVGRQMKKRNRAERCAFCERVIPKTEAPWVIKKRLIVCKDCYDKFKEEDT
jgi:hypothetical protein